MSDYPTRSGVYPISWETFHGLCKGLAIAVAPFAPEIILPVGRGGYYPGTLLAHMLQVEIYPVRLTRRINDVIVRDHPHWLIEPPVVVTGKRVLIVDEICSSGETLDLVKAKTQELGARDIRTAVLYAHTWCIASADYIGLISDALLLNPWDREILTDGTFRLHPEYTSALALQGLSPDRLNLIDAPVISAAKT